LCKTSEFLVQEKAIKNMHSVYINMSVSDVQYAGNIHTDKRSNSLTNRQPER
jgi:hypothetical protein